MMIFLASLPVPYTEVLKSVRTALKLSQKAFAEQVGIVPSYYYKIEEGNRRPSRKIYQKICAALEATGLQTSLLWEHPLQWRWKKKTDWRSDYGTEFDLYSLRDYLIPNIQLSNTSDKPLGKYGKMRRAFLAENNPILLDDMILTETLFPHLWEIDETAHRRVEQIMTELLEKNPAPDKSTQQLAWVQHMSSLKAQAEEVVNAELIFC